MLILLLKDQDNDSSTSLEKTGDSDSIKSDQNTIPRIVDKGFLCIGMEALYLLFTPIDNLSERTRYIWMATQVISLTLIILALVLPLFWLTFFNSIGIEAAFLSTFGSFLMMLSIILYSYIYHRDEDDILSVLDDEDEESPESIHLGITGL